MEESREDIEQNNVSDSDLEDLSPDDVEVVGLGDEEDLEEEQEDGNLSVVDELSAEVGKLKAELDEEKSKYLLLYADFDNYRKRMLKDKEELVKYANENIIHDLLPSLDTLEIALKHTDESSDSGLVEGLKNTFRELLRTLEKYGLKPIEAEGRPFDPEYHHAVAQVERDDMDEKTVVESMRTGYLYRDKVLRASMVSVSVKPSASEEDGGGEDGNEENNEN